MHYLNSGLMYGRRFSSLNYCFLFRADRMSRSWDLTMWNNQYHAKSHSLHEAVKNAFLKGFGAELLNHTFSFMESTLDQQCKVPQFMFSYFMGQRSRSHVLRGPIFSSLQQLPVSFLQESLFIHPQDFLNDFMYGHLIWSGGAITILK